MFKRLITAVFIMGLLVAFTGIAMADLPATGDKVSHKKAGLVGDPAYLEKLDPPQTLPAGFQRSSSLRIDKLDIEPVLVTPNVPFSTPGGGDCFEDEKAWLDEGFFGCGSFVFGSQGSTGEVFAVRYNTDHIGVPAGQSAQLYSTAIDLWRWNEDDTLGANDLTVHVYSDNAGIPGALLESKTIPAAALPATILSTGNEVWFQVIFDTPVPVNGTFHVGFEITGDVNQYGSRFTAPRFCDGFNGNSSNYFDPGTMTWIPAEILFDEDEANFMQLVSYCTDFTDCFTHDVTGGAFRADVPGEGLNYWGWSPGVLLEGFAQRFVAEGPETLNVVKIQHRDQVDEGFDPAALPYNAASTNTYTISIYPDAGGVPDIGAGAFASQTLGPGLAALFPAAGNTGTNPATSWDTLIADFTGTGLVVNGPYHIVVVPSSLAPADGFLLFGITGEPLVGNVEAGSANGLSVLFGGHPWENSQASFDWFNDWEVFIPQFAPFLLKCQVEVCPDLFADCQTEVLADLAPTWDWVLNDPTFFVPMTRMAQKITGNEANRLEKVRVQVEVFGAAQLDIVVWSDGGAGNVTGTPRDELFRGTVASPVTGWNEVVIPGGLVVFGDFYVGLEAPLPATATDAIVAYTEADDAGAHAGFPHATQNGGVWFSDDADLFERGAGAWASFLNDIGWTDNLNMEADFCAVPIDERACGTSSDWPTIGFDMARSSASDVSVGDAWCDMTLNWNFKHATLFVNQSSPIIYGGNAYVTYQDAINGEYAIFDLISGSQIGSIPSVPGDFLTPGGNLRCTPTIANIGGVDLLFVAGGTNSSILAYDITNPATPVQVWAIAPSGWLGHTNNMSSIRFGTIIIQNQGGTDVLYFTDDASTVYAAEAATGLPFAGWRTDPGDPSTYTPVSLAGSALKSGASDGSSLYFATFSAAPGDIYSINGATGAINWQLSATDGLQGQDIWGDTIIIASNESFQCGLAVDDGQVYASSFMSFPDNGVYYDINSLNGTIKFAALSIRVWLSLPVVDVRTVTWPTYSNQTGANFNAVGGHIAAFSRVNGSVVWANSIFQGPLGFIGGRYRTNPAMSCEVDGSDLLFAGSARGYFSAFNNDDGTELFHRRIGSASAASTEIGGAAIGADSNGTAHVVMVDASGGLYDLWSTGVDRPRLEIMGDGLVQAVEFNSPVGLNITFPGVYRNSGCADLVVTLVADEASNSGFPNASSGGITTIRDEFSSSMNKIADQLTDFAVAKIAAMSIVEINESDFTDATSGDYRTSSSRAASAVPDFLIDAGGGDVFIPSGGGFITAPGDIADITVNVVGPLVNRGPQSFFVVFQNNDPDYWLNTGLAGSLTLDPEIQLTLVGGCLLDTAALNFGVGAANFFPAFNTGRISGFAVLSAAPVIDGNSNIMFAGTYVYGVSQQRQAMSADVWSGAYGTEWISMQGDPNFCSNECKPTLMANMTLGSISSDGLVYVDLIGDMVCRSWIDSVEAFNLDGDGWDWVSPSLGFDNDSTIGTSTNSRLMAVRDEATTVGDLGGGNTIVGILNNCVVDILEITERNGNTITNFSLGCLLDPDINADNSVSVGVDTTFYDASVSTSWSADNTRTDIAAGYVKLPFGCGETPMVAARGMDSDQIMFNIGLGFDSTYGYMQLNGQSSQTLSGADEQAFYTFLRTDIGPNETIKFGAGYFSFSGIDSTGSADNVIGEAAHLMNKWVGFGRGDVNNDNAINLADIISLAEFSAGFPGAAGPYPFAHLGDVDGTPGIDGADVLYLVEFYFNGGPCPIGAWEL